MVRHHTLRATGLAHVDHIGWISLGKKAETRDRRIATACTILVSGKRRACYFELSGICSKSLSASEAAE